jgi:siroheme synthase (precorrin-2 oxidase/ferrochelatase)
LAAAIRDQVAQALDPTWVQMADAMQSLRPVVRQVSDRQRRREMFRLLASEPAVRVLEQHGLPGLRRWLGERFPELKEA